MRRVRQHDPTLQAIRTSVKNRVGVKGPTIPEAQVAKEVAGGARAGTIVGVARGIAEDAAEGDNVVKREAVIARTAASRMMAEMTM